MMCMQQNVNVILVLNWNCLATEVDAYVMTVSFQIQIHDHALISINFKPPICKHGLLHCNTKNTKLIICGPRT